MTMKHAVLFLLLLPGFLMRAQTQDGACKKMSVQVDSLVAVGENGKAYDLWKTSKCQTEPFYNSSEKLFHALLAAPKTDDQKKEYTAQLLQVYDQYELHFPQNHNANQVRKAMLLNGEKDRDPAEVYKLLDEAFAKHPADFTDASALYLYFDLYYKKLLAGEKGVSEDDVREKYDAVSAQLKMLSETGASKRSFQTAIGGINALAAPLMTCDKLGDYYGRKFDSHANDSIWLQNASGNLLAHRCRKGILLKIAGRWHELSPGPQSTLAFGLAQTASNPAQAAKTLETYLSIENDGARKSATLYSLALMSGTDSGKAIGYLKRAVEASAQNTDAYFLLAQSYVDSNCGATPFERKALNYLAIRTVQEAAAKNPEISKIALSKENGYRKKLPTRKEIKASKKGGETITYRCGFTESVNIPKP
jgi:hypothetical protein